MLRSLRCCLNPKVMASLIAAGLALWLVAPTTGTVALPLLVALVCPLSMGVMMWRMSRGGSCGAPGVARPSGAGPGDVDQQLRQTRDELAIARAQRQFARDKQPPA